MHADLERLASLNDLDQELDRVLRELADARALVQRADDAIADATRTRDAAQAEVDVARNEERTLQRKLEEYKTRQQGAIRILETGAGDPTLAERQLSQCAAILDQTETEMLELMERQDRLKAQLTATERALDKTGIARKEAEHLAPGRIAKLDRQRVELEAKRAQLSDGLPIDLRKRYDTLRGGKKKYAVARLDKDVCRGCQMVVGSQQIADIRRGLMEPCRGCGRWVVP
jgi:predicted  nucleic acid-binding Zn-ribbon protein